MSAIEPDVNRTSSASSSIQPIAVDEAKSLIRYGFVDLREVAR